MSLKYEPSSEPLHIFVKWLERPAGENTANLPPPFRTIHPLPLAAFLHVPHKNALFGGYRE